MTAMPKQTVKAGKLRLARFDTFRVYSYEISLKFAATRRVGVYKIGA